MPNQTAEGTMIRPVPVFYACLAGLCALATLDAAPRVAAAGRTATANDMAQLVVGAASTLTAAGAAIATALDGGRRFY